MNIPLLVHNVGFIASAIAALGACFFLLMHKPRTKGSILWTVTIAGVLVFIISHIVGVNILDPFASKDVFMFNICIFAIGIFNVHAVIVTLGKEKERVTALYILYALGIGLSLWFVINPETFLLPSESKLYLPNYYEPGILNWLRILFLYGLCVPWMATEFIGSYSKSENQIERKQLLYLSFGLIIGYVVAFIPNLLIYDISVDPLWGMAFMVIFVLAFLYAAVRYELLGIKIIAKQAFFYSIAVGIVGGFIAAFDFASNYIHAAFPDFPQWIIPIGSALVVVTVAVFVWRKLRESDLLKYEFISVATHKFRTPLTHIKWASENLSKICPSPEAKSEISYIQSANAKLVELTNILVNASETETSYEYKLVPTELGPVAESALMTLQDEIQSAHINITKSFENGVRALSDEGRLRFVIQTLIENAVRYTPASGSVQISVKSENGQAICEVSDTGIGMSSSESSLVFSKFYRSEKAQSTDTEGLGIGLFMCKKIIEKHNGKIYGHSKGEGSGSTFGFSLPLHTGD